MCWANKNNKLQDKIIFNILTDKNNKLIGYQMNLIDEGIRIRFPSRNNPMNYIYIIANIPKMLNKYIIEESDLYLFKEKYYYIVYERLFNFDDFLRTEILNRIDYKYDHACRNKVEKLNILETLSKARLQRYSATKTVYEENDRALTLYYNSKNYRINTYDKEEESGGLPIYENTIRYEVQIMSRLMNTYFKKYGLIRDIDNYWNMRNYFFTEYLLPIVYYGDYYRNNIISRMLNETKNKCILMDKIKLVQHLNCVDGIYTYSQIKQLQKLNINPLQNNFNLENPLKYLNEVC